MEIFPWNCVYWCVFGTGDVVLFKSMKFLLCQIQKKILNPLILNRTLCPRVAAVVVFTGGLFGSEILSGSAVAFELVAKATLPKLT